MDYNYQMNDAPMNNKGGKAVGKVILIMVIALLFSAAVIVGAIFYVKTIPSVKVKKQLEVAREYLEDGDYTKAIAAFEEALAIDPKAEDAYTSLAGIYVDMADDILDGDNLDEKDYKKAIKYLNQAMDVLDSSRDYIASSEIDDMIEDVQEKLDDCQKEYDDYKAEQDRIAAEAAAAAAAEEEAAAVEEVEQSFDAIRQKLIEQYGMGYEIGQIMPECTFYDIGGNYVSTNDFLGKALYINAYTTWCPYCDMEVPDMQATYEKYQNDIQFIMVDFDETAYEVTQYMQNWGLTIPSYLHDGWYLGDYEVQGVPTTFVLDKYGRIVAMTRGMAEASWIESSTVAAIEQSNSY